LKLAAEAWLEVIAQIPHCIGTSEEDYWRNFHRLRNHCTEMLPKDLHQPFIIKFRTIMLIKGYGPDFKLECPQATVVWKKFLRINISLIIILNIILCLLNFINHHYTYYYSVPIEL
jgi:hypothetical protein